VVELVGTTRTPSARSAPTSPVARTALRPRFRGRGLRRC